ncbi:hypothetical protein WDU94_000834 [Cyamophila willieti]
MSSLILFSVILVFSGVVKVKAGITDSHADKTTRCILGKAKEMLGIDRGAVELYYQLREYVRDGDVDHIIGMYLNGDDPIVDMEATRTDLQKIIRRCKVPAGGAMYTVFLGDVADEYKMYYDLYANDYALPHPGIPWVQP